MVNWEDYFREFVSLRVENEKSLPGLHPAFRVLTEKLFLLGESLAMKGSPDDVDWLIKALGLQEMKFFATYIINGMGSAVPNDLFLPLMRAAIDEPDPSFNAYFIEPCLRSFGPRRTNEHLLDVFESGTNLEKARAVNALYHAQLSVTYRTIVDGGNVRFESDALSQARHAELNDIWSRKRMLFLTEFIRNEDLDFKKFIVPRMSWSPDYYKKDELPLLERATELAVSLGLFNRT